MADGRKLLITDQKEIDFYSPKMREEKDGKSFVGSQVIDSLPQISDPVLVLMSTAKISMTFLSLDSRMC